MEQSYTQQELFLSHQDYHADKVLLGLSGGINSMAVLVWMAGAPDAYKPKELHLQYHHFKEHSPDTRDFVLAGVEYAKRNFPVVFFSETDNSVVDFFTSSKMIPHPAISPCSRILKVEPTFKYMAEHGITVNVVGYIREEIRRVRKMAKRTKSEVHDVIDKGVLVRFPIASMSDEWCFVVVKKEIGWYPVIYDIKDENGNRIFQHNNCLPCKNMSVQDMVYVKQHYPDFFEKAHQLTAVLKRHWGRDADDYYLKFGRPDHEKTTCDACTF